MEDIRFYDFDYNLLHILHDAASVNWTLMANGAGSFELHYPLADGLTQLAMERPELVAVQGEKQAVITGRQTAREGVLYGRTPNWLLSRFAISEFFTADSLLSEGKIPAKDVRSVANYVASLALGDIPGFTAAPAEPGASFADSALGNQTVTDALSLVTSCLAADHACHSLQFDFTSHRLVFSVWKGETLPAVLSAADRNAYDMEYINATQDSFSGGWYNQKLETLGSWDAEANSPALADNSPESYATAYRVTKSGTQWGKAFEQGGYAVCKTKDGAWQPADSTEGFWVRIPSPGTGLMRWETALSARTEEDARRELEQYQPEVGIRCKTRGLVYGTDYRLGDTFRVRLEAGGWTAAQEKRVSGVSVWHEAASSGEQPIFEEE